MIIVDDHLALLAIAGRLPDLEGDQGPVATTYGFQFRLARALADPSGSGNLSRRLQDLDAARRRVLHPPAQRLVVLDPRNTLEEVAGIAARHRVNLLLAELVGVARHHQAAVRVTLANTGRRWTSVMMAEGVDFASIQA